MVNPSEGLKLRRSQRRAQALGVVRRMVNPSEGLKHECVGVGLLRNRVRRMVNPSEGLKRRTGRRRGGQPEGPKDGQPE